MALKKRIAVVGLGSIGRRHARLLAARGDLHLELVEPSQENINIAVGEIGSHKSYGSFEAMLATRPDMVLIATPHHLHAQQAVAAMERGIDVLCEKPMCDSLDDAVKMKQAAARTGRILDIGFNLHFHPCLVKLKNIIAGKTLGKLLHLHARVGTYGTLVNSGSRYQLNAEGALFRDYAHQPDIFYWLSGEVPEYVYAAASQTGDLPLSSNPNLVMLNCEYRSGLLSSVHLNYIQEPMRHEYEVIGADAWCRLEIKPDKGIFQTGLRSSREIAVETIAYEWDEMYRMEHQAFLDAVSRRSTPESPPEKAIAATAICEAAIISWKNHLRVKVQL